MAVDGLGLVMTGHDGVVVHVLVWGGGGVPPRLGQEEEVVLVHMARQLLLGVHQNQVNASQNDPENAPTPYTHTCVLDLLSQPASPRINPPP